MKVASKSFTEFKILQGMITGIASVHANQAMKARSDFRRVEGERINRRAEIEKMIFESNKLNKK